MLYAQNLQPLSIHIEHNLEGTQIYTHHCKLLNQLVHYTLQSNMCKYNIVLEWYLSRGETIQVNAILHIVLSILQYIAILQYLIGFSKKTFHVGIWVVTVKKRIYTMYNCIKV